MTTYQDIKSSYYLDQIVSFGQELLGVRFKATGRGNFTAFCPFHADTRDSFRVYVNKKGEIRFHCFGACNGDWDIYDVIMLRNRCRFRQAQQIWADHLGIKDFKVHQEKGSLSDPEKLAEPEEEPVGFVEPKVLDQEIVDALGDAAGFYNDLLLSHRDEFKPIWKYLSRHGITEDTIRHFNIGFAPPYSNEHHQGRALINAFLPRFEADFRAFQPFYQGGLVRLLNDESAKGYLYYRRQIDFERKDLFSRNYGDYFAGRMVFPIFDIENRPVGFIGRRPDNRGIRWLKQQTKETAIFPKGWLYGIDKAARYIRHYRTIILVEGIFDYFAFYNLLQDQDKPVVVSTLGSHFTPEAASILKGLDIQHFIVAYDWDTAGRQGIERIAAKVGGWVYYLGGMKEGQDPFDLLSPAVTSINGFSLNRLMTAAKKAQEYTDKPVNVSFISSGPKGQRIVIFKPNETAELDRAEIEADQRLCPQHRKRHSRGCDQPVGGV